MSALTDSFKSVEKFWVPLAVVSGGILLVAAITIPNLLRSRMSAYESKRQSLALPQEESTRQSADRLYASLPAATAAKSGLGDNQLVAAALHADQAPAPPASTTVDRKLVRTGALELTVKSPADAAEQIRLMAESMGGYLETAQIGGTKEVPTADLTIRVPAARFSDATLGIRKLAASVESEKTEAQDVTRQYIDMEARLHNLRAEEAQYLVIMKSAYKVYDLLEVTEKLSEVRGQIEQQQAEFQTLSKQV